jgi:hypothetical protein
MMKGEKITSKEDFGSWSVFLLSEYWLSIYLKILLELFFFSLFFLFFFFFFFLFFSIPFLSLFFLCSVSWGLGGLMIFEEKTHFFNFFFQMAWHGMAWSWLWMYWRWTHIPKWRYARQYFWVRLANNLGSKSFLKFFQNTIGHIP